MSDKSETHKVGFVSLGCPKALVDSERILTQLKTEGYEISPSYQGAGVVVVNTCGFIDSAKAESLETIGEALQENGKVIVTGCMGVDPDNIKAVHPSVLHVTGPQAYEEVVSAVHEVIPPPAHNPHLDLMPPQGIKLTPRHYAYLKISEGCNHSCSFCIIPSMRGKLVSREAGDVYQEAERLAASGVKELLVISQDTSAYGVDLKYQLSLSGGRPIKTRLKDLCEALSDLGVWVRLHYVYPYPNVDDLIPLMAEGKLLPYLDIPFQHASPKVLKAMKRPAHAENVLKRIESWRKVCPEITLRSTFVVGFPGEIDEDFEHLLSWMSEAQLDRVGCFEYSPVDGAAANELANPVPEELKRERFDRFMSLQKEISEQKLTAKVGQRLEVLIDEVDEEGAIGRTKGDAPEIDGAVYLNGETDLKVGQVVTATIEASDSYDLWGYLD